jgi:hypothetical protein
VDCEHLVAKIMSGVGMRIPARWMELNLKGLKTQEGIEQLAGLTPLLDVTDRCQV